MSKKKNNRKNRASKPQENNKQDFVAKPKKSNEIKWLVGSFAVLLPVCIYAIIWASGLKVSAPVVEKTKPKEISKVEKNLSYLSAEMRELVTSRIKISDIDYLEKSKFDEATIAVNKSLGNSHDMAIINKVVGNAVNYFTGPKSTFLGGKRFFDLPPKDQMDIMGSYFTGISRFLYDSGVIVYNSVYDKENGEVIVKEEPSGDDHSQPYFLTNLLKTGKGNCSTFPVIFVLTAQRLGLPVKLVTVGNHQFCRYDDNNVKINIETTNPNAMGVGQPDATYIKDFQPNKMMLENSTTMKSMSYRQAVSSLFVTKMAYLMKSKAPEEDINDAILMSYYFDPNSIYAVTNMISMLKSKTEIPNREALLSELTKQGYRIGVILPSPEEAKDFENLIGDIYGGHKVLLRQVNDFKNERVEFIKKIKELEKLEQKYSVPNYASVNQLYPELKDQEALNQYHRDLHQKQNSVDFDLRQLKHKYFFAHRKIEMGLNGILDKIEEAKQKNYLMDRETIIKVDNTRKRVNLLNSELDQLKIY